MWEDKTAGRCQLQVIWKSGKRRQDRAKVIFRDQHIQDEAKKSHIQATKGYFFRKTDLICTFMKQN